MPLATTTGWNFRAGRIGNPSATYPLLGSYIPFARTKAEREARRDPRPSIEERYRDEDDYRSRLLNHARRLVNDRLMLEADAERYAERQ